MRNAATRQGFYQIGIIGGGPSAVCLLDALAQREDLPPGSVAVFEPSEYLWRGRPYRPDFDSVRVNAPACDMSLRHGDTGHFENWLATRGLVVGLSPDDVDPVSGNRFVSRASYGDYLEQTARAAVITLQARGWLIDIVRDAAVRARPAATGGLILRTADSGETRIGITVLCVGAGQPLDRYGLAGVPGYIAEPYPVRQSLAPVAEDADVCVLGSGLTGVDVVLGLIERGHRGQIRLVSRSGALPAVRQTRIAHALRHFTVERFRAAAARGRTVTLAEAVDVMALELADAGDTLDRVTAELRLTVTEDPVARLRRQLGEVNSPRMGLRILQQAVPEVGPDVWPLLPEAERARLLSDHERTVMSLCCPMPPGTAVQLLNLIDSGQLEVIGGVRQVTPLGAGGFRVRTADRDLTARYTVNATNARARRISASAEPLISSLIQAGLAELHPRGGVCAERAASRLTVLGVPQPGSYALGDTAAGSLFFTFGIQSLVDRAADIVGDITKLLKRGAAASAADGIAYRGESRRLVQIATRSLP